MSTTEESVSVDAVRERSFDFRVTDTTQEGDGLTLEGYAAVFNSPTEIDTAREGRFIETIAPGAFKRTIGQKGPQGIRMQFDHGGHPMIGSIPIGNIESIKEDARGLFVRARLADNWLIQPVRDAIYSGAIDGMSFKFRVLREDRDTSTDPEQRTVREVELYELGPVVWPAYADTSVGVRAEDEPEASNGTSDEPDEDTSEESVPVTEAEPATEAASAASQSVEEAQEGSEVDIDQFQTVEDLTSRLVEIKAERIRLDAEAGVRELNSEARAQWDDLKEEKEAIEKRLAEKAERQAELEQQIKDARNVVPGSDRGPKFPPRGPRLPEDIYDLPSYRNAVSSPEQEARLMRDGAMKVVEGARFPLTAERSSQVTKEDAQGHVQQLLDTVDLREDADDGNKVAGVIARRIIATGAPAYRAAFRKTITGGYLSPEESRALSVGTGSAGGFAVVFDLDPTIVPISNFSVNPYRGVCRVVNIAGTNEWRGVSATGIAAVYAAESTEATDQSPTLAQPAFVVQRAHTFVPFSYELGSDWGGLETELARNIQDAKDDNEATQFATGVGTTVFPQGMVTGATTSPVIGGTTTVLAVGDLYAVEVGLPPRFRPRAQFFANRFIYNKIRQLDTAGGANLWMYLATGIPNKPYGTGQGNLPQSLLGYPTNEATGMAASLATTTVEMVIGDPNYYVIVDRVGMDMELIPNLFGGTNRYPTGQRGLYAIWRNTARVFDPNAFRRLTGL